MRSCARSDLDREVASLYPAELSGGMQKRVGLARAIAADPEIIFFDEPTTGLDPIMADVINNLIVDCVKRLGATTISITHDMASARKIADDIAMIHKGEIIWQGPAKTIDDERQCPCRPVHPWPRRWPDPDGSAQGVRRPAMLFMVTETFKDNDMAPIYQQVRDEGRMLPTASNISIAGSSRTSRAASG